jgi:hypothetical protein
MAVTEAEFVEMNQRQMYSGKRADGSTILPPYAPLTVFLKVKKGQPVNRVTLKDTGNFYEGEYLRVQDGALTEGSTDAKSDSLQNKYGNIFGLGGTFKKEYVQESLRPAFMDGINQVTGLK